MFEVLTSWLHNDDEQIVLKPCGHTDSQADSGIVNIYVHGYSAFFTSSSHQDFLKLLAGVDGATNLLLAWPADHILKAAFKSLLPAVGDVLAFRLSALTAHLLRAVLDNFAQIERNVARQAEQVLTEIARQVRDLAPHCHTINLIGHSLGARLLVKSLLANPEQAAALPLNHLVLMGGAIGRASVPWAEVVSPLRGNVYNCYSSKDLALVLKPDREQCIGRYPIETQDADGRVRNINFPDFDHMAYWPNLKGIIDYLEVIEPNTRAQAMIDTRPKDQRFAENDADLFPILQNATEAECQFLAEVIASKFSASIKADERAPLKLAIELQRMAGDTLMNVKRGHGVTYREMAFDVARKLDLKVAKDAALTEVEERVAEKLIDQLLKKLGDDDRAALEAKIRKAAGTEQELLRRASSRATALGGSGALMGLASFLLERGTVSAIPVFGQVIAAFMVLASAISATTAPAYSVTIPAVLIIGMIRARLEEQAIELVET